MMRGWIKTHLTGTAEANARLDAAYERLEAVPAGEGETEEYLDANEAVWKAMRDVPAPRRSGWI